MTKYYVYNMEHAVHDSWDQSSRFYDCGCRQHNRKSTSHMPFIRSAQRGTMCYESFELRNEFPLQSIPKDS